MSSSSTTAATATAKQLGAKKRSAAVEKEKAQDEQTHFVDLVLEPELPGLPAPDGVAPTRLKFEMRDVELCVANALRRAIMAEVRTAAVAFDPTAGAAAASAPSPPLGAAQGGTSSTATSTAATSTTSDITFIKNTSVLHNEFLGHRLSLVPIGFTAAQLATFDPAHYRFVLHVHNKGDAILDVTTKDIKVFDITGAPLPDAERDALFAPSPVTGDHVLLVRLKPAFAAPGGVGNGGPEGLGEEVHVEFRARMGRGRDHARWSPVSECYFRNKIDPDAFAASLEAAIQANGSGVDPDPATVRRITLNHAALEGQRCYLRNRHGDPAAFMFCVKTETRLRPAHVVLDAWLELEDMVRALAKGLRAQGQRKARRNEGGGEQQQGQEEKGGEPGEDEDEEDEARDGQGNLGRRLQVRMRPIDNREDLFDATVRPADHTLGNLVQGMLYGRWVRDEGGQVVPLVGYHQPHPLEDGIVFRLQVRAGVDAVRMFAEGAEWIADHLAALAREWGRFAGVQRRGGDGRDV